MKKLKIIHLFIVLTFIVKSGSGSDTTSLKSAGGINGIYKSGLEVLTVDAKNNTFILRRTSPELQDVAIPICYGTIAEGSFQIINKQIYKLNNDSNFSKVYFNFKQEKKLSEDSFYFEVILPNENAFGIERFNYLFRFGCSGTFNSREKSVRISRNKIFNCENNTLGLVIQDLMPYCSEEQRCSQRIYFRIFDLLRLNKDSNYFTISLNNFNECYIEKMDVNNEYIFFDGNNIRWRGKEYRKVK